MSPEEMVRTGRRAQVFAAAAYAVGVWGMVFLFHTPRGDRALRKLDRVLFPEWLTK